MSTAGRLVGPPRCRIAAGQGVTGVVVVGGSVVVVVVGVVVVVVGVVLVVVGVVVVVVGGVVVVVVLVVVVGRVVVVPGRVVVVVVRRAEVVVVRRYVVVRAGGRPPPRSAPARDDGEFVAFGTSLAVTWGTRVTPVSVPVTASDSSAGSRTPDVGPVAALATSMPRSGALPITLTATTPATATTNTAAAEPRTGSRR
jgi:hypothetical protein